MSRGFSCEVYPHNGGSFNLTGVQLIHSVMINKFLSTEITAYYYILTDLKKETLKGRTTVGNTIMIHLHKNPFFFIKSNSFICSCTKHVYLF